MKREPSRPRRFLHLAGAVVALLALAWLAGAGVMLALAGLMALAGYLAQLR